MAAVTVMEGSLILFGSRRDLTGLSLIPDNPLFNSGKGAVFNVDGKVSPIHLLKKCVSNKTIE